MELSASPPSTISLRIRWEDAGCVLHISGELDIATEALLRDAVAAALDAAPAVTLDMSDVAFADCRGVSALVDCVTAGDRTGRPVFVRACPPSIERMASLLPDVSDAIDRAPDRNLRPSDAG